MPWDRHAASRVRRRGPLRESPAVGGREGHATNLGVWQRDCSPLSDESVTASCRHSPMGPDMMPKVSVIIPNQKNAPFVAETIETLLGQTMKEWELIVVDDGSDSDLSETVHGYADRYTDRAISLVIASDRPYGIPALVNRGFRHMNGEYFAWLNPGELLEPGKFEVQVRFLEENPRAGLVHSACMTIDPNGNEAGEFHPHDDGPNAFLRLLEGDAINPNTALVRRRILDEVGPFVETDRTFPELWRATAYRHTLRIALKSEIGCIDRVLQRSRSWSPDMEYSRLSLGSPLERGFVADCFEEEAVTPTPEIVAALGRSGLIGVSTRAFRALSAADQARALELVNIPGIDRTWFARHSTRWSSPAFPTPVSPPAGRVWRLVREESDDLSGTATTENIPKVPDSALEQHLLIEIEDLGEALETDRLLAARMLLDWASNAANFAVGGRIATETAQVIASASAAETYYEQFLPNRGAIFCGGMAGFYDRVLKLFGYDSFTINFGDLRNDLNHVAVSVPIRDGATWKHYVFDPTFNTTFHDRASGRQLDFFELVDAPDAGDLDWMEAISGSVQGRDWVSIGSLKESFFGLKEVMGDRYVYGRSDGRLTDYFERYKREFAANGYEPGLRGLLQLMRARMFAYGPCECRTATDDFVDKLQAGSIPLGPP